MFAASETQILNIKYEAGIEEHEPAAFNYFCRLIYFFMKYTDLFFDLDGTLTNSKPGIFNSALYAVQKLGLSPEKIPSDLTPFIGPPLRESFKLVFGLNAEQSELATIYYREFYGNEGMHQYTIYKGIPEALKELSDLGYRMSIVTSKAEIYAVEIIRNSPLNSYFSMVSGCELNGERSEKSLLITYNAERLGITLSNNILMIGDRYHDLRGARQAGISAAGVLYGFGSFDEIENEKPDLVINEPTDLVRLIHG
ncbi:MAG: phosphoglycolate [Bacteroidetes bacterium]|nr:MAG: phosphoglycolate [Bacteroidota bacterium]